MAPGKPHILIVDDEAAIRALLRARLELDGYRVSEATDGATVWRALHSEPIDLITLDLSLGNEDGLALARELRARSQAALVMISGRTDEVDRIVGLELGADDYITKPFSPREVSARIKAVLRRTARSDAAEAPNGAVTFRFEGGALTPATRSFVNAAGEAVELTTLEFNLLELFLSHPHHVLSRDTILNAVRGHDWAPFDRSVDAAIGRLRKKIEPDPKRPRFIKTVRNIGYQFSGATRRVLGVSQS
jgi:two-component system, OmpR family, response regulator